MAKGTEVKQKQGHTKVSKQQPDLEKRRKALDYRLRGYSYQVIGDTLNIHATRAYQLVKEALEEKRKEYSETIEEHLQFELDRIERMLVKVERHIFALDEVIKPDEFDDKGHIVSQPLPKGMLDAMWLADKLMDRKAKLLGIYRENEGKNKDPLPWSDDE